MIDLFLDLFDQRKLEQWSCYLLPIERNELGNYRSRSDRDIAKMSYEIDCITEQNTEKNALVSLAYLNEGIDLRKN